MWKSRGLFRALGYNELVIYRYRGYLVAKVLISCLLLFLRLSFLLFLICMYVPFPISLRNVGPVPTLCNNWPKATGHGLGSGTLAIYIPKETPAKNPFFLLARLVHILIYLKIHIPQISPLSNSRIREFLFRLSNID